MAGGMDLGGSGKGRRKPLDAAINLVPFIDLMAVTISFLIMTAVWTQVTRLQVSAGGGAPSEAPPPTLALTLTLSERGLSLEAGPERRELARVGGALDAAGLREALRAVHAGAPDLRAFTVRSEDAIHYGELVRLLDVCAGEGFDTPTVEGAT